MDPHIIRRMTGNAHFAPLTVALLALTACASVPTYPHDPQAQQFKEASNRHAWGAALLLDGIISVAVGGIQIGAWAATDDPDSNTQLIVGSVATGVGIAVAVLGAFLLDAGDDGFTPPPELPKGCCALCAPDTIPCGDTCVRPADRMDRLEKTRSCSKGCACAVGAEGRLH